jgi:hypothetical protein
MAEKLYQPEVFGPLHDLAADPVRREDPAAWTEFFLKNGVYQLSHHYDYFAVTLTQDYGPTLIANDLLEITIDGVSTVGNSTHTETDDLWEGVTADMLAAKYRDDVLMGKQKPILIAAFSGLKNAIATSPDLPFVIGCDRWQDFICAITNVCAVGNHCHISRFTNIRAVIQSLLDPKERQDATSILRVARLIKFCQFFTDLNIAIEPGIFSTGIFRPMEAAQALQRLLELVTTTPFTLTTTAVSIPPEWQTALGTDIVNLPEIRTTLGVAYQVIETVPGRFTSRTMPFGQIVSTKVEHKLHQLSPELIVLWEQYSGETVTIPEPAPRPDFSKFIRRKQDEG